MPILLRIEEDFIQDAARAKRTRFSRFQYMFANGNQVRLGAPLVQAVCRYLMLPRAQRTGFIRIMFCAQNRAGFYFKRRAKRAVRAGLSF